MARALGTASSTSSSSLPLRRTRRGPDASQNAIPKRRCGDEPASTSWTSSTVLMKCDWARTTLRSSGFSTGTVSSSMSPPSDDGGSVGEHVAAELDEERVVVALVLVGAVVVRLRRPVGHDLLRVDRADRADVRLVARRARRALLGVDVEDAVAEDRHRLRVGLVDVLPLAVAGFHLGEQDVVLRVELVDALHRADVDAGA